MRQIYMRRWSMQDVLPNTDEAIISFPVPNESIVNSIQGEMHMVATVPVDVSDVVGYGFEGWLLSSDEMGTDFLDHTTLWDVGVPKDDGLAVILDSDTPVTAPMFEPGLINESQLFNQEVWNPERVYQRSKLISFANTTVPFASEAAADTFFPLDYFKVNINKKIKTHMDAGLVFGVASPAWDVTGNNDVIIVLGGSVTKSLYALAHIDDVIDKAMIDFLLLHETGAESPYDDLMTWLSAILDTRQESGSNGSFTQAIWTCTSKMTMGMAVPGSIKGRTLGPDMEAQ